MFDRILVVCMGNICRSPVGEALLKTRLPNKSVSSAGIATQASGLSDAKADNTMFEVALSSGIDMSGHRARQLDAALCDEHDLILVMEPEHVELVSMIAPSARHKVLLFGQWGSGTIADPYKKEHTAFERALSELTQAAQAWSKKLV